MKNTNAALSVKQSEPPIAAEVMEQAIVDIASAMKRLEATRLKRSTIVTLIWAHSKVGKREVEVVLNCLSDLESLFLKPKPQAKK